MILYRVITKLFHIFTLFVYGVFLVKLKKFILEIFYEHICDQTLSFIYTCLLLLLSLKTGLIIGQDFIKQLKKKNRILQ